MTSPTRDDIDLSSLWHAIKRRRRVILGLPIVAFIGAFVVLSLISPQYTSQARLLIDSEETVYTRPAVGERAAPPIAINQAVVTSQVQVLTSQDIARKVIEKLDLKNNPEFNPYLGDPSIKDQLMALVGLKTDLVGAPEKVEEAVVEEFSENLSVFPVLASHVINISFTSKDKALSAKVANALAQEYVAWQREAKLRVNQGATKWLSAQISALREKVKRTDAEAEKFRARSGQQAGGNALTLNAQQLSELNSQLILAKAQQSETEARAKLIKGMLRNRREINAASDVLRSPLIQRLLETKVSVERVRAQLSATMLPGHPRIQQLNSELTGLKRQIRDEINKVAASLNNEAAIARARVASLTKSLNALKSDSLDASEDTIKLRALEREARVNRSLLESYLARYRDASARRDSDSVPASAQIISRAYPASKPSFPRVLPMSALAMLATFLLAFGYVVSAQLMTATFAHAIPAARQEPSITESAISVPESAPKVAQKHEPAQSAMAAPTLSVPPMFKSNAEQNAKPEVAKSASDEVSSASPKTVAKSAPSKKTKQEKKSPAPAKQETAATSAKRQPSQMTDEEAFADALMANEPIAVNEQSLYQDRVRAEQAAAKDGTVQNMDDPVSVANAKAAAAHLAECMAGETGYRILACGEDDKILADQEVIDIARSFAADGAKVILVDFSQGSSSLSGHLSLARAPGLAELVQGRADLHIVTQSDKQSNVKMISAGQPVSGDQQEKFFADLAPVFAVLDNQYDVIILNASFSNARDVFQAMNADFDAGFIVTKETSGTALADSRQGNFLGFTVTGLKIVYCEKQDTAGKGAATQGKQLAS